MNICNVCHKEKSNGNSGLAVKLKESRVVDSHWKPTDSYSIETYEQRESTSGNQAGKTFYIVKTVTHDKYCCHEISSTDYTSARVYQ